MKTLAIKDLIPGMVLGETVYTSQGQLIMEANSTLTSEGIYKLSFYNISHVNVEDSDSGLSEGYLPNPSRASNPSNSQKVKSQPEFMKFQIEYTKETNALRQVFDGIIANPNAPIDLDQILNNFSTLVASINTTVDLFDKLHNMRLDDDSVYSHCLNVALIARRMGKWLRFSREELNILTLCGLFHDIGKTSIPDEILNKPEKYTDEEFTLIKQHPLFGYKLLKKLPIDDRIKKAALQHHERCDGSGYPQGLLENSIDDYAEIIAIADVYDATTAARSYRAPLCPFQAIALFQKDGLQKYRPQYILTFLNRIASTYQNNRVLLNSGQSAKIVMINAKHLTKPMIQMDDGSIIDMLTKPELEIIKII
ncbi:MAG: HD-GYP domain-containing protein [Lachnospiraceae bacterium]|jgi:putative nucleotidyltransferase with HDIG domain|nr:HD-GYP domain-containing protein [Lachnospiraceae bacterium]